jgi:3-deoxy-manno-octulosonate cytidylyltransferase (CMP-KDO synthetase)
MPSQPIVVIPARLAATRLPNKPLADIGGQPMVVHVWRRAVKAAVGPVIVASGDAPIAQAITQAGGIAIATDPALPSGSDRVFAALQSFDPAGRHDIVINLQGDLPAVDPACLQAVLAPLADPAVDIATLVAPLTDSGQRNDPNVVKAVLALPPGSRMGRALYFSRAAIPSGDGPLWEHIGIYAYRRAALARFVALPPSPLEKRERLEQLRAMEAGMVIAAAVVDSAPLPVDTPADLERLRRFMAPRR